MCFAGYHFTMHHMIYSRFEYLENRISLEGLKNVLESYTGAQGITCCHCCCCLVAKLCLTLYNSMNCSLPGSSVHGIIQARILEWVAISFSRGSSQPRDHPLHWQADYLLLSHQGSPRSSLRHS